MKPVVGEKGRAKVAAVEKRAARNAERAAMQAVTVVQQGDPQLPKREHSSPAQAPAFNEDRTSLTITHTQVATAVEPKEASYSSPSATRKLAATSPQPVEAAVVDPRSTATPGLAISASDLDPQTKSNREASDHIRGVAVPAPTEADQGSEANLAAALRQEPDHPVPEPVAEARPEPASKPASLYTQIQISELKEFIRSATFGPDDCNVSDEEQTRMLREVDAANELESDGVIDLEEYARNRDRPHSLKLGAWRGVQKSYRYEKFTVLIKKGEGPGRIQFQFKESGQKSVDWCAFMVPFDDTQLALKAGFVNTRSSAPDGGSIKDWVGKEFGKKVKQTYMDDRYASIREEIAHNPEKYTGNTSYYDGYYYAECSGVFVVLFNNSGSWYHDKSINLEVSVAPLRTAVEAIRAAKPVQDARASASPPRLRGSPSEGDAPASTTPEWKPTRLVVRVDDECPASTAVVEFVDNSDSDNSGARFYIVSVGVENTPEYREKRFDVSLHRPRDMQYDIDKNRRLCFFPLLMTHDKKSELSISAEFAGGRISNSVPAGEVKTEQTNGTVIKFPRSTPHDEERRTTPGFGSILLDSSGQYVPLQYTAYLTPGKYNLRIRNHKLSPKEVALHVDYLFETQTNSLRARWSNSEQLRATQHMRTVPWNDDVYSVFHADRNTRITVTLRPGPVSIFEYIKNSPMVVQIELVCRKTGPISSSDNLPLALGDKKKQDKEELRNNAEETATARLLSAYHTAKLDQKSSTKKFDSDDITDREEMKKHVHSALANKSGWEDLERKLNQVRDQAYNDLVRQKRGVGSAKRGLLHMLFLGNAGTGVPRL
jgi:hypothetical protein